MFYYILENKNFSLKSRIKRCFFCSVWRGSYKTCTLEKNRLFFKKKSIIYKNAIPNKVPENGPATSLCEK